VVARFLQRHSPTAMNPPQWKGCVAW
jgi:hypothetical protein